VIDFPFYSSGNDLGARSYSIVYRLFIVQPNLNSGHHIYVCKLSFKNRHGLSGSLLP